MTKDELEAEILELCTEDYFGVWELYWPYSKALDKSPRDIDLFANTIKELVDTKKIACYEQKQDTKQFQPVELDFCRLKFELEEIKSGDVLNNFYWFALKN